MLDEVHNTATNRQLPRVENQKTPMGHANEPVHSVSET